MGCNVWIFLLILAVILVGIAIWMGNGNRENFFDGHGIIVSWQAPSNATSTTRYQWFACNQTANATCSPTGVCSTTASAACPITANLTAALNSTYTGAQLDFGQNIAFSVRSIDSVSMLTSAWVTTIINANSPNTGTLTLTSSPTAGSTTINNPPIPGDTILNLQAVVNQNIGGLPGTVPNATIQITRGADTWAWNAGGIQITTTSQGSGATGTTTYTITADTTSTQSVWIDGPTLAGVPGPLQVGDVITFYMLAINNVNTANQQGDLAFYGQTTATVTAPVVQPPGAPTAVTYSFT